MKKAIFNIVVYAMLIWSILSAIYIALPTEYQAMIPFDWLTALISGGSTALLGSGGLVLKTWINKAQSEADSKYSLLADNYLEMVKAVKGFQVEVNELKNAYVGVERTTSENNDLLKRNNRLLETDLNAKLSNEFIDECVKTAIDGVLSDV